MYTVNLYLSIYRGVIMLSPSNKEVYVIGIFGSNGKTSTANMLWNIFFLSGLKVEIINDEKNAIQKRIMTDIEVYKQLIISGKDDIILIEINKENLENNYLLGISFDMIIHTHISEGSYENTSEGIRKVNELLSSSPGVKTIILNTDDSNWKRIIIDIENTYLITYGLGNKATVTASSIECGKDVRFCYCLQREIRNKYNTIIVPMEIPFVIKTYGQYNVYNGLAVITVSLIYGIEVNKIISSLNNNAIQKLGLSILYENGFGVVNNICENLLSFETGFEAVQNMPYDNIHLIFNLNRNNITHINKKVLESILTWALILKIKKIYYFNTNDSILNSSLLDDFKTGLKDSGVDFELFEGTIADVEKIINSLNENDMLLYFCCKDSKITGEKIIEILDTRILGNLSSNIK